MKTISTSISTFISTAILTATLTLMFQESFSQNVHHQMISAQGKSIVSNSGWIVKQTVGQLSISGNFSGSLTVQQGFQQSFQQSFWDHYSSVSTRFLVSISPNPFTDQIQFNLSSLKNKKTDVQIFDVNGRIVYRKEFSEVKDQLLTLYLKHLSIGMYLVKITSQDFNHFSKIIKK